ncbi:MAG: hypothetical protein U0470_09200 [Anaerolineae bacterium]
MLSGIGFDDTGGPLLFNHPGGMASDGTRLLLADRNNNRVLVWNAPPAGNTPPDLVIGQGDFTTNAPGVGRDGLNWPCAVAAGANGRLAIADTNNDRLLLWARIPSVSHAAADIVINLPRVGHGAMVYAWPWGVWTDGDRLIATATHGSAILIWQHWPAVDDAKPDLVLTDPALGTPRAIISDGTTLIVDDHNARLPDPTPRPGAPAGGGGPHGVATLFWRSFPTAADDAHDFAVQGVRLRGGYVDGKLVLLGDRTMRIFDAFPTDAAAPPSLTVAGPWSSDGVALAVAGGQLYTMDENDNRVLAYPALPTGPDARPAFAIGADDTIVNSLETHFIITNPVPASDGRALYVSSDFDRKLYVWSNRPDESGAHPDWVYRLPVGAWDSVIWHDMLILAGANGIVAWSKLPRDGELPDILVTMPIGGLALRQIRGVTRDDRYFYLSDYETGSIYVFDSLPTAGQAPIATLTPGGRPSRLASDGTYLAVCIEGTGQGSGGAGVRSSIALYRVDDIASAGGAVAPAAYVTAPGLNLPQGVHLVGGGLYVADTSSNRVAIWHAVVDAIAGGDPDVILGARNAVDRSAEIGRDKLFMPGDLWFDGDYLWVGEFKFANRLLRYSPGGPAEPSPATSTAPAATATRPAEATPRPAGRIWLPMALR